MQFEMKQRNYIVCPQCKNDTKFECFGERVDYGIFSIRIQCRKCKWVSDELYEETGYFPDLNKDTISYHVKSLHDMQQENKEK
jgi:ribosomal protein L37AE/L43A